MADLRTEPADQTEFPAPPAISVVLPTYNRLDTLPLCLEHLEHQTFGNFEVIVVDDGSTDGTPAFLGEYEAAHRLRLHVLRQANSGPARARNLAISAAQAPLCIIMGDDILADPTFVETHRAFHAANPDQAVAALGLTVWSESEQVVTPFMRWVEHEHQFDYRSLLGGLTPNWRHFYTSNLSVKTELLRRNPFNEQFRKALMEDSELGYRLWQREDLRLEFLPAARAGHVHPIDYERTCRRAREAGRVSLLLESLWPELAPRKSPGRLALHTWVGRRTRPISVVTWVIGKVTRVWCPNPLLKQVLLLQGLAGRYGSR